MNPLPCRATGDNAATPYPVPVCRRPRRRPTRRQPFCPIPRSAKPPGPARSGDRTANSELNTSISMSTLGEFSRMAGTSSPRGRCSLARHPGVASLGTDGGATIPAEVWETAPTLERRREATASPFSGAGENDAPGNLSGNAQPPSAARSRAAMSMRFICIIDSKARLARAGLASPSRVGSLRGTICQDRP
jgi:hypothetical protein